MSMNLLWQKFLFDLIQIAGGMIYLWLPPILFFIFWKLWVYYVRMHGVLNSTWTLLEIKLPREILKSPKAMELALHALHQQRDGNLIAKYWEGFQRASFSLEIASFGGDIHFFVRLPSFFKKLVEAQFYAQYPDVEIMEVDDYIENVPYLSPDNDDWDIFGAEFKFVKPDAYPIKTYIDYGITEDLKEEFKVDPITHFLEFMGSLKSEEQIWFQIMIRATKDRFPVFWSEKKWYQPKTWFKQEGWEDQGKRLIEKLMKRDKKPKDGVIDFGAMNLSPGERDVVTAVERNISKLGFDTGIRALYLAKKEQFHPINFSALLGSVKQYSAANLNGFKPTRVTSFDYPWQDPFGRKIKKKKRSIFDAYRKRAYFYWPYIRKPMILNTEELATIYHFPGKVAATPTFKRIESKRSEPPVNLPT